MREFFVFHTIQLVCPVRLSRTNYRDSCIVLFHKTRGLHSRLYIFRGIFRVCCTLFIPLHKDGRKNESATDGLYVNTFLPKAPNYVESHAYIGDDLLSKISVDEKKRKIYFWEPSPIDGKPAKKAFHKMPYILIRLSIFRYIGSGSLSKRYTEANSREGSRRNDRTD